MPLTATGLTVPRFLEIIESLEQKERSNISPDINTSDDELLGQLNSILSERFDSIYQLILAVNDNFNVDKAEGKNLDDLGELKDVLRLSSSPTQGDLNLTGDTLTEVSQGSVFNNPVTKDRFILQDTVILDTDDVVACTLSVETLQNASIYSITINSSVYSYTSDGSATIDEIMTALNSAINSDGSATWTSSFSSVNNEFEIVSDDGDTFSVTVTANLSVDKVTVQSYIIAEEDGPIQAAIGTITEITIPSLGLDSVTNPEALITGRNTETDEEYRIRIKTDQNVTGKATIPAIEANLRNTPGVTYAVAIQNNTMTTDGGGRPPKSVECIVQGATDQVVASVIWAVVGAGIETFGGVTEVILDEDGDSQEIKFSRPSVINIAVNITYSLYDEEIFPDDGEDTIRQAVLDYINGLGIDVDVIPKRIYTPIYTGVNGIGELTVEVQEITNAGDPPSGGSWQETTLAVAESEYAQTSLVDIYITEV